MQLFAYLASWQIHADRITQSGIVTVLKKQYLC